MAEAAQTAFPRVGVTDGGIWYCEYSDGQCDAGLGWDEESATLCAGSHSPDGQWLRICDDCGEPAGLWRLADDLEPFFSCTNEDCMSANNTANPAVAASEERK